MNCLLYEKSALRKMTGKYGTQVKRVTAFPNDTGYPHDGRADKDSYPHDGRADKDSYPHDGRADKDSYPHDRHNQYGITIYRNGPKQTFVDTETDSLSTETDSLGTETDFYEYRNGLSGYRIVIRGVKIDRNTKK